MRGKEENSQKSAAKERKSRGRHKSVEASKKKQEKKRVKSKEEERENNTIRQCPRKQGGA
jgi:hypothetical protein